MANIYAIESNFKSSDVIADVDADAAHQLMLMTMPFGWQPNLDGAWHRLNPRMASYG